MPRYALRCIRCDKQLVNVESDGVQNQPNEGLAFSSDGHYGSTAFDPMDLSELEINVCDDCLRKLAGEDNEYILSGRYRIRVVCEEMWVGWMRANPAWLPWTGPDMAKDDKELVLDLDDLAREDRVEAFPEVYVWNERNVKFLVDHREDIEGSAEEIGAEKGAEGEPHQTD